MMFDVGTNTLSQTCIDYLGAIDLMCGEEIYAALWLKQVIQAALIWDHMIDGDPIDPKMFDLMMTALVTEWPRNPFLRKYADYLIPTAVACISAWRNNTERELHYSVYRELPCAVAFVIGGNPLVEKYMPLISNLVRQMRFDDDERDGNA